MPLQASMYIYIDVDRSLLFHSSTYIDPHLILNIYVLDNLSSREFVVEIHNA